MALLIGSFFLSQKADAQRYWNTAARVGNGSYIALKNHSSLSNLAGSFTMECWFNADSAANISLFGKNGARLLLEQNGSNLRGRGQTNNGTRLRTKFSTTILPGKWYHLAFSYNANTNSVKMYINGNLDSSSTTTSTPTPGTDSVFIGKSPFGTGTALIDEVRMWNYERSAQQIKDNFRSNYNFPVSIGTEGVLMYTSFDQLNSGPFIALIMGDGNNTFFKRGPEAVHIGSQPSTTIATNTALKLDGLNGYVVSKSHPNTEITGIFTMEAWINPDTIDNTTRYILRKGTAYSMDFKDGKIRFLSNNAGGTINTNIPINKWTHIAYTLSSDQSAKIYYNGVYVGGYVGVPFPGINTDSLHIGNLTLGNVFKGYIDAVKITNYDKSLEEIRKSMYEVVDTTNGAPSPYTTTCFNFDSYSESKITSPLNSNLGYLRGNAQISRPYVTDNIPVSPMIGGVPDFPEGYIINSSDKRIPEFNTSGLMKEDTLNFPSNITISDLNVFIALNHENQSDLRIDLISPAGDSLRLWSGASNSSTKDHIITVFDDQADVSVSSDMVEYGPRVKFLTLSLNSTFGGKNALGKWRLKITDQTSGNSGYLYSWGIQVNNNILVGVDPVSNSELPELYLLKQNYPNPFNPVTKISYSIPKSGFTTIKVYDILGKEVKTLVNETITAGSHVINFDGTGLNSGVYFYKLESGAFSDIKKMILIK